MQGKTYKYIADDVADVDEDAVGHTMRGHRQPVTCVGISGDEKFAYSGGKDSVVCQCESTPSPVSNQPVPCELSLCGEFQGDAEYVCGVQMMWRRGKQCTNGRATKGAKRGTKGMCSR